MIRVRENTRSLTRAISLLLASFFAFSLLLGAGSSALAANEEPASNFSFYDLSSHVTTYFDQSVAPASEGGTELTEGWRTIAGNAGSAGSMLGYADTNRSGDTAWAVSRHASNASMVSYATLEELWASDSTYRGLVDYAYYGKTLNQLGLDHSSMGGTNPLALIGRWLVVGLIMITYAAITALEFVKQAIFEVLYVLNPFNLLKNFLDAKAQAALLNTSEMSGFDRLAIWLSDLMNAFFNLSVIVMVPFFIGVFFFTLVVLRNIQKARTWIIKAAHMLFFGMVLLPIVLPMTYSATISAAREQTSVNDTRSREAILSTFVDNESWFYEKRMEIPNCAVIEYDIDAGEPTDRARSMVRDTALCINQSTGYYGARGIPAGMADNSLSSIPTKNVFNMLSRWANGATLDPSTFESTMKGSLTKAYNEQGDEQKSTLENWFKEYKKVSILADRGKPDDDKSPVTENYLIYAGSNVGLATDRGANDANRVIKYSSAGSFSPSYRHSAVTSSLQPTGANLSPLATYNYLSTSFKDETMIMYSSNNSSNQGVREVHRSVTAVGNGYIETGLSITRLVVYMLATVVIFIVIYFGMLRGVLRSTIQFIPTSMVGLAGSVPAIARALVLFVSMLISILCAVFMEILGTEVLWLLPKAFEELLYRLMTGA